MQFLISSCHYLPLLSTSFSYTKVGSGKESTRISLHSSASPPICMSASTLVFCSLLITPFLPSNCYITTHKTVRLHVLQQSVFVALPHFLTAVSSLITLPKSFQATDFSCWLLISPLDRVQRESISIHVLITHFTKIHFNIILSSALAPFRLSK